MDLMTHGEHSIQEPQNTLSSQVYTEYSLGWKYHRTQKSLNKFKDIGIIPITFFSYHNVTKLKVSKNRKSEKFSNMWK